MMTALLLLTSLTGPGQTVDGLGAVGPMREVASGLKFCEGPAADANGVIHFTDIPANRVYRLDAPGKLSVALEDSKGANGTMFDAAGNLILCQGGLGRIAALDLKTGKIHPVAERFGAKPFNQTNDLVVDLQGGVYFTDPLFANSAMHQGQMGVYYRNPKGDVLKVAENLSHPNGILLSPDEKTLYVLPSRSPDLLAYPVLSPGKVGAAKVLYTIQPAAGAWVSGGDGMTADVKGNLYLTAPSLNAVVIITPAGKELGMLKVPQSTTNCTFGDRDMRTLYVTAGTSVYAFAMPLAGHRFGRGTVPLHDQ